MADPPVYPTAAGVDSMGGRWPRVVLRSDNEEMQEALFMASNQAF